MEPSSIGADAPLVLVPCRMLEISTPAAEEKAGLNFTQIFAESGANRYSLDSLLCTTTGHESVVEPI